MLGSGDLWLFTAVVKFPFSAAARAESATISMRISFLISRIGPHGGPLYLDVYRIDVDRRQSLFYNPCFTVVIWFIYWFLMLFWYTYETIFKILYMYWSLNRSCDLRAEECYSDTFFEFLSMSSFQRHSKAKKWKCKTSISSDALRLQHSS